MGRILIVEDEAILASNEAEMVERIGHQVVGIAATAEAAIDMATRHAPDLVLMDIMLRGGISGIRTTELIRQKSLKCRVIYVTAHSDPATMAMVQETAPDGFLVKPLEEDTLRATIDLALMTKVPL